MSHVGHGKLRLGTTRGRASLQGQGQREASRRLTLSLIDYKTVGAKQHKERVNMVPKRV